MARAPQFSKSSASQGVARKSYQVGRQLGNRGTAMPAGGAGAVNQSMAPRPQPTKGGGGGIGGGGIASGSRNYPKGNPISAQYGPPVMDPNNLQAVQAIGKQKAPKAPAKGFVL